MKNKTIFLLFGIGAILLTSLGYLVDSDPPYADFKMTLIEFLIISVALFGLFSILYFAGKFLKKLIKTI